MKLSLWNNKTGGDGGKTASHKSSGVDLRTVKLESLKGRAFAKASSFKYDNPFTVISMQPSYVLNHLVSFVYFIFWSPTTPFV